MPAFEKDTISLEALGKQSISRQIQDDQENISDNTYSFKKSNFRAGILPSGLSDKDKVLSSVFLLHSQGPCVSWLWGRMADEKDIYNQNTVVPLKSRHYA